MSFKRDLVKYTRIVQKGRLTAKQKQQLKNQINAVIDAATRSITIEAIVQPPGLGPKKKQLKKRGRY